MNQVIDFSTLTWVKNELDETLKEARQSLEAHVENPQDEAQLGFLVAHLHQVYGTLRMVELYGASLLAEEMEQVAKAIADDSVSQHDDACDVLMRAILQLPDYLERLIAGYRDIPLVLLPILNDLRAVRGDKLLSENSMFSPDINASLPESVANRNPGGDVRKLARGLRHRFQIGLLGWFRNKNTRESLDTLSEVLEGLLNLSSSDSLARQWWVAAGIVDALKMEALDSSVAVKRLIGHIDRQIKSIIDDSEDVLVSDLSDDLFKNMLFYVAQAQDAGPRVEEIQATYRLKELLPDEEELAAARESLSGQNADLFETVAVAVKEELGRLKDSLDIVLRNGCADLEKLQPLTTSLRSLGDTLGMLSLGAAREAVVSKAEDLQHNVDTNEMPPETLLMDVASALLFVESSVDGMGFGRAVSASSGAVEEQLAESELSQVMDVVIQEAITDLIRAKEAIVSYADTEHDKEALKEVVQLFNQVKGGLQLLNETRAATLVASITKYIDSELIQGSDHPPQQELDSLADAVCGLEYYLESRKEHRMYGSAAMVLAEEGVDRLGYPASPENGENESADALEYQDAEETLIDSVGLESSDGLEAEVTGEVSEQNGFEGNVEENTITPMESEGPIDLDFSLPDDLDADQVSDESPGEQAVCETGEEEAGQVELDEAPIALVSEPCDDTEVFVEASQADVSTPAQVIASESAEIEEEDDGLAVIGDEVDEEILEIFIEEAEEEMASIDEQLPTWINNPEDSDALGSIRRSYHTLKGSGRLVGAMRIGEFAWAYENMLNRLIDGTVPVSTEMTDLLKSASVALPELVQQIKDGSATRQPIAHLMRCADALSKGESLPLVKSSDANVESDDQPAAEQQQESFVAPEPGPDEASPAMPEAETATEAEVEAELETQVIDVDELVYDGVMDPMLYEIFNSETRGHLEVIRQFLNQVAAGNPMADESLARALHTLHGSAHMAEAEAIANLSGQLERWVKALMGSGQALPDEGCRVLQASAETIEKMMSSLPSEITEPEEYGEILKQVQDLYEAVHYTGMENTASEPGDDDAATERNEEAGSGEVCKDPYAECDDELLEIFLEESAENLETGDSALHRWSESSDDSEALSELQRALHTLKGGARMADLAPIGDLAHAVESLIISISDGLAGTGQEALDGVQQAHDQLAVMLDNVRNREPIEEADELVSRLEALREKVPVAETNEVPQDEASVAQVDEEVARVTENPYADADPELLEVFLEEAGDIMENSEQTLQNWKNSPTEVSLMAELQRELHTLKGGARMADITEIGDLAHSVESLMVKVTEGEVAASGAMFSVLEQAHDALVGMVDKVRHHQPLVEASEVVNKLELLRDGKEVAAPVRESKRMESPEKDSAAQVVALQADAEHEERRAKPRASQELVRVKANLLDNMVNYAGEVSIYRSRLEQQVGAYRFNLVEMDQTVARVREQLRKLEIETEAQVLFRYEKEAESADVDDAFDPLEMDRYSHMQQLSRSLVESVSDLGSIQNLLENITRESETLLLQQSRVNTELQEGLMRTRMVPFLGLAARMRRIIRQTSQELGKKAELELSGAEGEMDRTVVDRIIAPIEHMLRNALSHGIELPEQRASAGKPETGTISITLERESSDVVLRIADDGAGIKLEAIRQKAIERGLMEPDSDLTDNEVLQFILETGFSTAEKVTQVAGRGVGMDVVNSEVKQLGGSLHIDSEPGKGTTFTVRLPFTLALNQALLIEVGEDTYAIPLSSIEGIVRMRREDLKAYYDDPGARFNYGGYEYEVSHLGSVLGTGKPYLDSGPGRLPVLLARVGDHCVAFQVENLLGSREIVVKSVGPQISTVRGVSGATILGDGRVVMILDVAALLRGGAAHAMAQVEELLQQPVRTEGITVMVVDDSITVRKVTTRLLERNDMNVISAKDGVDAVSKLQEHIPDIMLLDIEMPRMDGFELATHVRNEARLRDVPIIMITSRTGDKHRQRAMQIGVNRYLGKPFQETDLLENIRALLEEQ